LTSHRHARAAEADGRKIPVVNPALVPADASARVAGGSRPVPIRFEEMVFDLRDTPARAGSKLIHCDSQWEASMPITAPRRGCSDDTCPAVYDTSGPALVAVQGSALTGPKIRADRGDIPGP
jgi:hypothetical protein